MTTLDDLVSERGYRVTLEQLRWQLQAESSLKAVGSWGCCSEALMANKSEYITDGIGSATTFVL